jgi:hypothetical protein
MDSLPKMELQLDRVKETLLQMPKSHQLALALWCCERLFPAYRALAVLRGTQEAQVLRALIDRLWDHVFGRPVSPGEVDSLLSQCDKLEFDSDCESLPIDLVNALDTIGNSDVCEVSVAQLQRSAMDAVGAVWLSIEACRGDTAAIVVKAAQCYLERVHGLLWDELSPTNGMISSESTQAILNQINEHPRMIEAYNRVQDQLSYLQSIKHLARGNASLFN